MAGAGNNAPAGRKAGHFLCPLESCEEGELCPHAVHMAPRVEDGMEKDAPNAQAGRRQRMERCRHGQQRAENPLTAREVVVEAGELFGVSSTRFAPGVCVWGGDSSDPNMIGYSHSSRKTNQ